MRKRRLLKWMLTAVMSTVLLTVGAAAFEDTEGHWAEESIRKWSEDYQILTGYSDGTFRPDRSITRGAFAGILNRFLQYQETADPTVFSDTAGTYWEEEILKLNAAGVYLGTSGGKAMPGSSITRQQAVTMIARAFHIEASTTTLPYEDVNHLAGYAKGPVAEMTFRGYIDDCPDGVFRPLDPITRAELVNILDNMIEVLVQTPDGWEEDVDGTLMISSAEGVELKNICINGDLILAPGVGGSVTLTNVEIKGEVLNFSEVEPQFIEKVPEEPDEPEVAIPLRPEDIYTPGRTTGETFIYDGRTIPVYADAERNTLTEKDFYWEGDRLVYTGGVYDTQFGIDVSAYQNRASANGMIDWDAVKADGVDFAMVRIGLRGTSTGAIHADAYYAENIDGAMAAGIETGVYFFAQAITIEEAIEEAEFVIELLKEHEINGPVAYDWEMLDASYRVYGTPPEVATACAIAFCQRIEEAGYTPMIYAGTYVSYIKYDQGAIAPYLSWYPEYKSESSAKLCPQTIYQVDYWQFSSSCKVDGIGGRVDANLRFLR